jgi:AAA15 family ATPase/GTPase
MNIVELSSILNNRQEIKNTRDVEMIISSIFYGRPELEELISNKEVIIRDKNHSVSLNLKEFDGLNIPSEAVEPFKALAYHHKEFQDYINRLSLEKELRLVINNYHNKQQDYLLNIFNPNKISDLLNGTQYKSQDFIYKSGFVKTNLYLSNLTNLWDTIIINDLESKVTNCLKIINSNIERIAIVGEGVGKHFIIKHKNFPKLIPLSSLGEGVSRILCILLHIINHQNGVLLIDEFENGLHYEIQYEVWQMLFKLAQELNVQVFATTHSFDCIKAFTQVANEDKEQSGVLIRLEQKEDKIVPVHFSEEELEIITRRDVEVR